MQDSGAPVNAGDWNSIFEDFANEVYKAKGKGERISRNLYNKTAERFTDALMKGYEGKMDFAYNDPNNLLAAKLRSNLFAFSAAKSLNQYRDFAEALIDKDGGVKSFNDFRKDVEKINALYNENWLKTEYETAIASAQAAAAWEEIVKNKDVADKLQYITMDDGKVRPEHMVLHLLIASVDDKIWDTIYPPNAWRCRCKVKQLTQGALTSQTELYRRTKEAKIQPMFKTNVGKTAMVVDRTHPYFKNVKGNLTELDAVKNYGLRNWSAMHSHMQSYAPAMPSGKSKDQYKEWWSAKVRANGVGGENFALADKLGNKILFDAAPKGNKRNYFREHVANREYAWLSEGVITNPDEVWSFYDIRGGKALTHTYLKYYEEDVLAVVVREKDGLLKAETIYSVTNEETFNNLRKGVLLHANKKF